MPAPPPVDRNQPSFLRFPIQNARTGFKPMALPVILVVPRRRNENGTVIGDSNVFDVKYFIAQAPDPAKVAGPFNAGILVPPLDQFVINVNSLQLSDVLIPVSSQTFIGPDSEVKSFDDAQEGDQFEYTLIRGSVRSTVPFFPDADYYDLSNFAIDVEDLPRPKRYLFVWQASYNRRVEISASVSSVQGQACVNVGDTAVAQFKIEVNHPGEVHNEMFQRTPPLYFEDAIDNPIRLADDQTLEFYRPFADLLQDIFDEQIFLNGINHIDKIPAQLIPYLAFLIGWDLPNFPGVTDAVRRSVLRQAVKLQQLKGSKRAIVELFDIFGFTIDIINLWFSADGTRLIGPGESLPAALSDQEISSETRCQIDPLTIDFKTNGFGQLEIPLIQRPTGNITISAFLVKAGDTRDALGEAVEQLTQDPSSLESQCVQTLGGNVVPQALLDTLPDDDSTLIATSEVFVDITSGRSDSAVSSSQIPLINDLGVTYDSEKNLISVTFDHYLDFSDDTFIYLFATYPYDKITVPPSLENLRSNRFDVRILLKTGETPNPQLFEFLMNFVFKLKAFHSLLRKIIFRLDLIQTYNVQDLCFGEDSQLQVPPPVIPEETEGQCADETSTQGFKEQDLRLRELIFNSLLDDFQSWKSLDGTHESDPLLDKLLNLPVNKPEGEQCQFTQFGQGRVTLTPDVDLDHNEDPRQKVCDERPPIPDNCFTGRVKDNLNLASRFALKEVVRCRPCGIGMGSGFYWLYPSTEFTNQRDGFGELKGQFPNGLLGRQAFKYDNRIPYSLHFSDRPFLIEGQLRSDRLLAYERPSLEVDKDTIGFAGHRFISMANLMNDFTHPIYKARPWDDDVDLNAELQLDSSGDEVLVFDEEPVTYTGNGLMPDISSFGNHDDREFLVTHKVFMATEDSHPAITLDDRVVITDLESLTFDSDVPFDPLFSTFNPSCNQDFIDGYPAETGRFDVDPDEFDFDLEDSESEQLSDLLGVPVREQSGSEQVTALFTFGSQILLDRSDNDFQLYKPLRLDCECEQFECPETGLTQATGVTQTTAVTEQSDIQLNVSSCSLDFFRSPDGTLDFNCDQLRIDGTIKLRESLGVCSRRFDGSIPNLLCILEDTLLPEGLEIDPEGRVHFKDEYGVIYEMEWVVTDDILDILFTTKQPRVWGEPASGFVRNRQVFRKGIITTIRQIIRAETDGSYTIIGQGSDQKVDTFVSNVICGEEPFVDNFCFHLDCYVTDEIEFDVLCGPRWVGCDDNTVQWSELVTNSSGDVISFATPEDVQPFQWIDVWDTEPDDITGICVTNLGSEEVVEVTYTGDGGLVPAFDDGSGIWPSVLPFYPFMSQIDIDLDRRVVQVVSIELLDLQHSFSGDLHAVLLPPDQSCPGVTIFHRPGSVSDSFGNFGDFDGNYKFVEAETSRPSLPSFGDIPGGTYGLSPGDWPGGILPIGSFDDFVNLGTLGAWRLFIFDWSIGDKGSLGSWRLTLRVSCAADEMVDKP